MDDLAPRILRRCFHLAKLARNRGNGPFGAILARGSVVLFEAESTVTEPEGDSTCHPEMNLLREASQHFERAEFADFTLYCSAEPCPMCTAAASICGVGRIVFGAPVESLKELQPAGFEMSCRDLLAKSPSKIEVEGPLLLEEALPVLQI